MMKKRIVVFALLCAMIVSLLALPVGAVTDEWQNLGDIKVSFRVLDDKAKSENIKEWFNYVPSYMGGGKSTYYYRDSYFFNSSFKYNEHLATMSQIIAMVSSPGVSGALYNESHKNASRLFSDIGFSQMESNYATDASPTPDTIGVIMAKKTIIDDNEPYTLVAIGFRSGGYGSEWANNFTVGTSEECPDGHLGFHKARDRALDFIIDYLDRNVDGNVKLWISGFSRGGALSGLTGAWFNDNAESLSAYDIVLSSEDIFTYTFEAPASISAQKSNKQNYNNIFNIISPNDFIPLMPFKEWGLVRPGIDHNLPAFAYESAEELNEILKGINPNLIYDAHKFVPGTSGIGKTQAEFINKFAKIIASRLDRDTYAKTMQTSLSHIFDKVMNASAEELAILFSSFASSLLGDMGISGADNISGMFTMLLGLIHGDDSMVNKLCDALGKNFVKYNFIETFDIETRTALLSFLKILLYKDDGISLIPYMLTIIKNARTYKTNYGVPISVNSITAAHNIELILASLMCEDNYYKSGASNVVWTAGHSAKDDVVTVAINDGKRTYSMDYPKNTTITVTAVVNGCLGFEGWYVDGTLVTDTYDYTFVVDNNISVYAVPVIEHKAMSGWTVDEEAFAFSDGVMSCFCSACGSSFAKIEPAPLGSIDDALPFVIGGGAGILVMISGVVTLVIIKKRKKAKKSAERKENSAAE